MFCVKVEKVIKYNENLATIVFNSYIPSYPGQFVMVNVFGYEEIPLSLSSPNSVTVKAVGETTRALVNIKPGEYLGIRGPFGRPFTPARKALIIGGGIGMAPLSYLYDFLIERGCEVDVIYGAKTSKELIFKDRFSKVEVATDDGSIGFKGNVVELIKSKGLDFDKYERIYCCGPKAMLKELCKLFKDQGVIEKVEISLERYIRCGIGLCGSCVLENGLRVCVEGPVFNLSTIHNII
ncbi:MAG TPA: dihydroorotate dehydrogenase electron transfer subunit [Archaeoglobus profundus]|nr:dihydroorotate dehydrogenase electron transfer subunit [Archaeoglobus profundus]